MISYKRTIAGILLGLLVISVACKADNNDVILRPYHSDNFLSSIMNNCLDSNVVLCINSKVLAYLESISGLPNYNGRSYAKESLDEAIYDRVGRILSTHEIQFQLPKTLFQHAVISYRPDNGLDLQLPVNEARGILLKKKLLLPVLLLLKLKMKALMPIFVALIGIKAIKALILSKIAIKLVLGFIVYQLFQKLGGMKMSMMPMMPMASMDPPMAAYGALASSTPASSYEPSWEPSGGPYSRAWEPSAASSSQNNAYNPYYPSSSSSSPESSPTAYTNSS